MSDQRIRAALLGIAGIAGAIGIAFHAYLGHFSRFMADDYCSAAMAERFGLFRAVWYWYLNWSGRYSASTLDALAGLAGPQLTPYLPLLATSIWLVVLYHLILALLPSGSPNRMLTAAAGAAVLVLATLILSPQVPQSLYWGQGMRSVIPPLILITAYADLLLRLTRPTTNRQHARLLAASFLLTFFAGGFNETFSAVQAAVIVAILALSAMSRHWLPVAGNQPLLAAGAIGSVLALAIVAASPGNVVRQAFYPPPAPLPVVLARAAEGFSAFVWDLLTEPGHLVALLGAIALSAFIGSGLRQGIPVRSAAVPLLFGLGAAFASFVPAAYALSDSPPERTLLLPAHFLLVAGMLSSGVLAGASKPALVSGIWRSTVNWALGVIAAACMIAAATSVGLSTVARVPEFRQYASHWDANDARIRQAAVEGRSEIWIQPRPNWAGLNEPNDNPRYWVNDCMSRYYEIQVFGYDLP